jgi:hypothetical protein
MIEKIVINVGRHKLYFENRKVIFATAGLMFIAFSWGVFQGVNAGYHYFGQ